MILHFFWVKFAHFIQLYKRQVAIDEVQSEQAEGQVERGCVRNIRVQDECAPLEQRSVPEPHETVLAKDKNLLGNDGQFGTVSPECTRRERAR